MNNLILRALTYSGQYANLPIEIKVCGFENLATELDNEVVIIDRYI